MNRIQITLKFAGPAGVHREDEEQVKVFGSAVLVRWPDFMLAQPKPAQREE